ncbi:TPA: IS66 family insertion sequence element accessory protein TnpB [Streptococcus suis]
MTIRLSDLGQVYLVCGITDMRQGIDSLAYLVKSQFNLDPPFQVRSISSEEVEKTDSKLFTG